MEKYSLLTAKEYRSCLYDIGDWNWEVTSWRIYSDKSYRMTLTFRPGFENRNGRKKLRRQSGVIDDDIFNCLLEQLSVDGWGEPDRKDLVCDGDMWEIKQYSPSGEVIATSGDINFIDGIDRPLDRILDYLPEPDESLFV